MKNRMRIKIILLFLVVSLIAASLALTSCCYDFDKISKSIEESLMDELSDEFSNEGTISYEETTISNGSTERVIERTSSIMEMSISQEGSDGTYFEKGKPVSFSALSLIDPDRDQLEFTWEIADSKGLGGEGISYIFNKIGDYTIRLNGKGENHSDYVCKTIQICETAGPIILLKEHECSIEIEYFLENKGPGNLNKLSCKIEVPKTSEPFQIVNNCSKESEDVKEIEDDYGNIFYQYYLGDILEGESASIKVNCDLILYEFDDKGCDNIFATFDADDEDLELCTGSETYIDSDSPIIIETVNEIVGNESNPYLIAEKLYNYIADDLDYDYELAANSNRQLFKASEILERGKGTCMDYSIAYAAVCRAAGIPVKYVTGIPVTVIVGEENQEIHEGHAWNEIKLPEYGWVPLDVTWESGFLTHNYCLDVETIEGLEIDYPGYSYTFGSSIEPEVTMDYIYRVDGIDQSDLDWASFSEYIEIFEN